MWLSASSVRLMTTSLEENCVLWISRTDYLYLTLYSSKWADSSRGLTAIPAYYVPLVVRDANLILQHLFAVFSFPWYPTEKNACLEQAVNWLNSLTRFSHGISAIIPYPIEKSFKSLAEMTLLGEWYRKPYWRYTAVP